MNRAVPAAGIGFDIDHTLAIDNKLERVAFLRLLEIVVADGGKPLGSLTDEIERIDVLLAKQREGEFTIDDAVRGFVRARGVTPRDEYVERFRSMAVDMVDEFVIPLPGTRQMFAALYERGIAMAVLSNGWNPLQLRKARRAGFEGDVLASADLGAQKPSPRAFQALRESLGTPPERTWYLGDDPRCDVAGARGAGLNAIWLDAENQPYPPDVLAPTVTVHALDGVAGIP